VRKVEGSISLLIYGVPRLARGFGLQARPHIDALLRSIGLECVVVVVEGQEGILP